MDQDIRKHNTYELGDLPDRRRKITVWDVLLWVIIVVLLIAVFVRLFVVSNVTVSGASMTSSYYNDSQTEQYNPAMTYHDGDTVTVNKLKSPERGDVVVFYKYPVKNKFLALFASGDSTQRNGDYYKLIKRVVAIGGDKLWVEQLEENKYRLVIETPQGDRLYEDNYRKNGEKLSAECFIMANTDVDSGLGCLADCTESNPLVIKEGYFFAMGDNRANSDDSRGTLGQVSLSQLFGVVIQKQSFSNVLDMLISRLKAE